MVITCTIVIVSSYSGFHTNLVWLIGIARDEISLKLKPSEIVLQDSSSLIKG